MSFVAWSGSAFEVNIHQDISLGGGGYLGNFNIKFWNKKTMQDLAPTIAIVALELQCLLNGSITIYWKKSCFNYQK